MINILYLFVFCFSFQSFSQTSVDDFYKQYFYWFDNFSEQKATDYNEILSCASSLKEGHLISDVFCDALVEEDQEQASEILKNACGNINIITKEKLFSLGKEYLNGKGGIVKFAEKYRSSIREYLHNYLNKEEIYKSLIQLGYDKNLVDDCIDGTEKIRKESVAKFLTFNLHNSITKKVFENNLDYFVIGNVNEDLDAMDSFTLDITNKINEFLGKDNIGGITYLSPNEAIQKCYEVVSPEKSVLDTAYEYYFGQKVECRKFQGNFCKSFLEGYYETASQLSKVIDEDFFTESNYQKLNNILVKSKGSILSYLEDLNCIPDDEKKLMKERVENTIIKRISILEADKIEPICRFSACCMNSNTQKPEIFFPPHYIALLNNGFEKNIEATMLHEMSHSLIGKSYINHDRFKKIFLECNGSRNSCIEDNFNLKSYKNLSDYKKLQMNEEAFCDDIMADILERNLIQATGENKKEIFKGILERSCFSMDNGYSYDTYQASHPIGLDRAKNLLQRPAVIEMLMCENNYAIKPNLSCGKINEE